MTFHQFEQPKYLGGKNGKHRKPDQAAHDSPAQAPGSGHSGAWNHTQYAIPFTINQAQQAALAAAYQRTINTITQTLYGMPLGSHPLPEVEEAGISAGEIIGHRCWLLNNGILSRMWLSSVFYAGYRWEPGKVHKANKCPGKNWYGEGFHAFKTRKNLLSEYGQQHFSIPVVYGTIEMWGTVIEHENGYRSEYAAIKSLDSISFPGRDDKTYIEKQRVLDAVRKHYRV